MCSPQTLDIISQKVYHAARDVLGNKLEKVYLFGSYARGDYDSESDIDYCVIADIPRIDVCKTGREIDRLLKNIDLEYDALVCTHITPSSIFHRFRNDMPYLRNVINDGKELAYA